jgi:hypothetical protein
MGWAKRRNLVVFVTLSLLDEINVSLAKQRHAKSLLDRERGRGGIPVKTMARAGTNTHVTITREKIDMCAQESQ